MEELEKIGSSSCCRKCGGFVDHISMICIMCGTDHHSFPPEDHEGRRNALLNKLFVDSPRK